MWRNARSGLAGGNSAEIVHVECSTRGEIRILAWAEATLRRDRARRVLNDAVKYEFRLRWTNPPRRSCRALKRVARGKMRTPAAALDEPSAEIARVERLNVWRNAKFALPQ